MKSKRVLDHGDSPRFVRADLYEQPTSGSGGFGEVSQCFWANGYVSASFSKTDDNTSTRRQPCNGGGVDEGTVGYDLEFGNPNQDHASKNSDRKPNPQLFQVNDAADCPQPRLHHDQTTNDEIDPSAMKPAAYRPDPPAMRMVYARYTAGVMNADRAPGRILAKRKT